MPSEVYLPDILKEFEYQPLLVREPQPGRNPLLVATGVSVVGKDYLLERTAFSDRAVSFGSMLAQATGLDRDAVRGSAMTVSALNDLQMRAADLILDGGSSIVNTHVVAKQNGVYVVNFDLEQKLSPAYYVAFVADPRQILEWRAHRNETSPRKSDVESVEQIAFHQAQILSTVNNLSQVLGAGFAVIGNSPENTDVNLAFLNMLSNSVLNTYGN